MSIYIPPPGSRDRVQVAVAEREQRQRQRQAIRRQLLAARRKGLEIRHRNKLRRKSAGDTK